MLEAARGVTIRRAAGEVCPGCHPETRRRDLLARLSVMSLVAPGRPTESPSAAEAGAVARAWLDLIHSGRSASSWAVAAPTLKEIVGPEEWRAALRAIRVDLGRCCSRRLQGVSTYEGLPGLPPGPYVVIRFESRFEARDGVIETVTTCRGDDAAWRAAAYFVR